MAKQVKSMTRLLSSLTPEELIDKFFNDTPIADTHTAPKGSESARLLLVMTEDKIRQHIHRDGTD